MSVLAAAAFAIFFGYVMWSTVPYSILMIRLTSSLDRQGCTWAELSSLAHLPPLATQGSISYIRGNGSAAGLRTGRGRRVFLANDDCTLMVAVVDVHKIRMAFYDRAELELTAVREGRSSSLVCGAVGLDRRASARAIESAVRRLAESNFNVSDRR